MKLLGRMDSECRFGNIVANSYISALITFATASAATKVPKWENLECEVKLSLMYFFWIFHSSLLSGGSQVPVLGRGHQLGRGAGGVRAVRRLAGQHRQVREQNCLLEFGHSKAELVDKWYWTGGKY